MKLRGSISRKSAAILIALAVLAGALSFASFEYSNYVSANTIEFSIQSIHTNAEIQASDIGRILANELESVATNLQIISNAPAISNPNLIFARPIFDAAQNSTRFLTNNYFWMDARGKLLLVSNGSAAYSSSSIGIDLSQRGFFQAPKSSGATYYSTVTPSLRNSSVLLLFVSQPVYAVVNGQRTFEGVVASSILLTTLGRNLQKQLAPYSKSSFGLLDFNGTVLYSGSESLIGQNVFASAFQNLLPSDLKPTFDNFLNESLDGLSGVQDISYHGTGSTLAYQPIFINITWSGRSQQFGVAYIVIPDSLSSSVATLISQQQITSNSIIIGISASSLVAAFVVLRWNKRLDKIVKEKTADLVATNKKLAEQTEAEKDLINIAAHELRTPTQIIMANAELMKSAMEPIIQTTNLTTASIQTTGSVWQFQSGGEIGELLDSTFRNAQRLGKLTRNLLEVARIDSGNLHLQDETFDLNDEIRQVIGDTQNLLETEPRPRKIEMDLKSNLSSIVVHADKTKVGEILSNLLTNAISHSTDESKKLTITSSVVDGFAQVQIKDEGVGIDPEIFPRLFTKFATKTGTGLGLFISKSFVEAHGGRIWARNNTRPDRGATFVFTLPLQREHA